MIRGTTPTVALLALLIAAPAGAAVAASAEPSLSVTVSDGVEEVSPGDTLEYVAVFENTGGTDFDGLVTLTPPAFVDLEADDATVENGALRWEVSIPAGERFEATATGTVGDDTGGEYQVVVLASALDASGEVLARSADSDRIAGAEAPPGVPGMEEPAVPVDWLPWVAIGGVLGLIAVVVAVIVRVRRRDGV